MSLKAEVTSTMLPRVLPLQLCLAGLALALVPPGTAAPSAVAATGDISMTERTWARGAVPTLRFNLTSGRGTARKVACYLYTSQEPQAFLTHTFPPQLVGVFYPPDTIVCPVDRPPERGPIVENSRERFVQGAVFDYTTGALLDVTNEDYIDIVYETPPTFYSFDFGTEDDFATPLVNGQDLSTPPEFGDLLSISALQPAGGTPHHGPAIFDTDPNGPNATSADTDLLVDLGNAVILQENGTQSVSGIFDQPGDSAGGGTLVFDFSGFDYIEKVLPRSIDLIDVDAGASDLRIFLHDVLGRTRTYFVPNSWTGDVSVDGPPGFRTLDLTSLLPQPGLGSTATVTSPPNYLPGEIVRMEIRFSGSGAVDNLVFSKESDPNAPATGGPGGPAPKSPDRLKVR